MDSDCSRVYNWFHLYYKIAGAVAVLVGRDAPIAFADPRQKATHASNVWDFYKPDHNVEYPTVDGTLSQTCYYRALEDCYSRFADKIDKIGTQNNNTEKFPFTAETPDYFVFHAPYNKLVQKSYARLWLIDARRKSQDQEWNKVGSIIDEKKDSTKSNDTEQNALSDWMTKPIEETYSDRSLESKLKKLSSESFNNRLSDANYASKKIGNTYTASVFMGLASLVDRAGSTGNLCPGKKITVFSYGSGALATMYMLHT